MSEDGKFSVEKFKGQNYQLWKMHMEDYLYQKDIFLPLGGIARKPAYPGDQILLKIQSARNRFKSNMSVGLFVMNPMQLIWVQTDVR
jgi:hypothetical protein